MLSVLTITHTHAPTQSDTRTFLEVKDIPSMLFVVIASQVLAYPNPNPQDIHIKGVHFLCIILYLNTTKKKHKK